MGDLAGVGFQPTGPGQEPNCWLTCITTDPQEAGATTDTVRLARQAQDIEAGPTWKPMHPRP